MKRIHQNLSMEQKIQTLKEDFLDRDQTTFVKIRRTGRLGWESSIPEGTPYSDYMLSPASDEDMIKTRHLLTKTVSSAHERRNGDWLQAGVVVRDS